MAIDIKLRERLAAVPVHSPRRHSRLPLDPRLARKFLRRSRSLLPEERAALLQYTVTAKWSPQSRATYAAVVDGFGTVEEISTVTGMTVSEVESAVGKLEKKGMLRKTKA